MLYEQIFDRPSQPRDQLIWKFEDSPIIYDVLPLFMTLNQLKTDKIMIFKWVDRGAEGPNPKSIHMRFFKKYF